MSCVAVIAGLGALITWFKAQTIQAPILDLRKAARRVGEGDLGTRITVSSTDEIGSLGGAFNAMTRGLEERERIRALFGSVVDPRVRDRLLAGRTAGEHRQATVVFLDLAGFTALSETLAADRVVALLNLYFEAARTCVETEGGLVNKFIGDGVLAVFGVPVEQPNHAAAALRAVAAFRRRMALLNERLVAKGYGPLAFRAGVHTGEVLAGVVGSRERHEYTVIGDAVNVASRLESLGKEFRTDIVVSANTREAAGTTESKDGSPGDGAASAFRLVPLGSTPIRGRLQPLEVYTMA